MRFELRGGKLGLYFFDTQDMCELSFEKVVGILNMASDAGVVSSHRYFEYELSPKRLEAHFKVANEKLKCQIDAILMHPATLADLEDSLKDPAYMSDALTLSQCNRFRGATVVSSVAIPVSFVRFRGSNGKEIQLPRVDL